MTILLRQIRASANAADAARRTETSTIARRVTRLANREDFYLRVTPNGYNWGHSHDPDGLLPTKYSR